MDKNLFDLYTDYLLASFGQTTATGLSQLVGGQISHDKNHAHVGERKANGQRLVADDQGRGAQGPGADRGASF